MCRAFPGIVNESEVTDEHMKEWIGRQTRVSIIELDRQVTIALSRIRFIPGQADPESAALRFFTSVTTELSRNRASNVLSAAPNAQLAKKSEPRLLKERMESRMR